MSVDAEKYKLRVLKEIKNRKKKKQKIDPTVTDVGVEAQVDLCRRSASVEEFFSSVPNAEATEAGKIAFVVGTLQFQSVKNVRESTLLSIEDKHIQSKNYPPSMQILFFDKAKPINELVLEILKQVGPSLSAVVFRVFALRFVSC